MATTQVRAWLVEPKLTGKGLLEMYVASRIQRLLFIIGVVLIGVYAAAYFHKEVLSRAQLRQFDGPRMHDIVETREALRTKPAFKVDFRLWSEKRIAEYEESLARNIDPPLALLHISKVQLEVPVLEGTDDLTLNRGVGHIVGTARPGEEGNIGIAGHRDGFFQSPEGCRSRRHDRLGDAKRHGKIQSRSHRAGAPG